MQGAGVPYRRYSVHRGGRDQVDDDEGYFEHDDDEDKSCLATTSVVGATPNTTLETFISSYDDDSTAPRKRACRL